MTLIVAIRKQQAARRAYVHEKIKAMDHKLGFKNVCHVWEMHDAGLSLTEMAEAIDVPRIEIKRLTNCTAYPHPLSFK